jgi:hypothetical protein
MNLFVHINQSLITKQLTNSLGIHYDQNSPNSLQNLVNSLVDLDSLCTSVKKMYNPKISLKANEITMQMLKKT